MSVELIRLAPTEWPGLAATIVDWNRRPDGGVHCLHAQQGDDVASHATELRTLSPDEAAFWVLQDDGRTTALVGCEFDPALQRAWVRGPLWKDPRAVHELLATVGPTLETALPAIRHFDAFPTLASEPLNGWLAAAGYAPQQVHTLLRAPIEAERRDDAGTVRRATPAEIATVSTLHRTLFEATYITDADLIRAVDAVDRALFVAAGANGRIAGYLYVQDAPLDEEAYIDYLGVDPDQRGRGVGSALLDAAARWGADHGRAHLALTVRADRRSAHALYRRRGFVEISAARHWRKTVAEAAGCCAASARQAAA